MNTSSHAVGPNNSSPIAALFRKNPLTLSKQLGAVAFAALYAGSFINTIYKFLFPVKPFDVRKGLYGAVWSIHLYVMGKAWKAISALARQSGEELTPLYVPKILFYQGVLVGSAIGFLFLQCIGISRTYHAGKKAYLQGGLNVYYLKSASFFGCAIVCLELGRQTLKKCRLTEVWKLEVASAEQPPKAPPPTSEISKLLKEALEKIINSNIFSDSNVFLKTLMPFLENEENNTIWGKKLKEESRKDNNPNTEFLFNALTKLTDWLIFKKRDLPHLKNWEDLHWVWSEILIPPPSNNRSAQNIPSAQPSVDPVANLNKIWPLLLEFKKPTQSTQELLDYKAWLFSKIDDRLDLKNIWDNPSVEGKLKGELAALYIYYHSKYCNFYWAKKEKMDRAYSLYEKFYKSTISRDVQQKIEAAWTAWQADSKSKEAEEKKDH